MRYGARAAARDAAGVCPAACAGILSLFYLATIQTYTGQRDSPARAFARTRPLCRQPEPPAFLERAWQGPPLFARGNLSAARRRRLALFNRQRVERMGHPNLRKSLVEHSASNCHGIPRQIGR